MLYVRAMRQASELNHTALVHSKTTDQDVHSLSIQEKLSL